MTCCLPPCHCFTPMRSTPSTKLCLLALHSLLNRAFLPQALRRLYLVTAQTSPIFSAPWCRSCCPVRSVNLIAHIACGLPWVRACQSASIPSSTNGLVSNYL